MPRALRKPDVCPLAQKGAGSGARWRVAAWVAFAAALSFGVSALPVPSGAQLEVKAASASRLDAQHSEARGTSDWVIGVVDPLASAQLEIPSSSGATTVARGRPDARTWADTRLHSQVDTIIRRLTASVLRQDNGRMADRPSLCICSAQGPPVRA
jgi:hypothetical protein